MRINSKQQNTSDVFPQLNVPLINEITPNSDIIIVQSIDKFPNVSRMFFLKNHH